jgi:hypothetical protein
MPRNVVFIAAAVGLCWGLKWFYGKRDGSVSDMPNKVYLWISIAMALGFMFLTPHWGSRIPGSFFERADYQGMFYVNLFPNGQKVKSYRVPALIRASVESDTDYDDRSYSWREYRMQFAVMPNGGRITFYHADEYLQLGKIVTLFDDNESYWGVELTDQLVRKGRPTTPSTRTQ